jgi:uncharacterized membrane protein YobD (UPF0266 family)
LRQREQAGVSGGFQLQQLFVSYRRIKRLQVAESAQFLVIESIRRVDRLLATSTDLVSGDLFQGG